jgi:hypothetical protein
MKKDEIIEKLQKAKYADLEWLDRAKSLIEGSKNDIGTFPIEAVDSDFGEWFYNEGSKLKRLSNNPVESMQNLELLHQQIHKSYLDIYHIYFNHENRAGFFSSLMGAKRKELSAEELKNAKVLLQGMQLHAEEFLFEIERLERRLEAVGEEKIDFIMNM